MKINTWQLQDAKSKFSQLVEKALHNGPHFVTRSNSGSYSLHKEYQEISRPTSDLVAFLRNSSLVNIELDISNDKNLPRD